MLTKKQRLEEVLYAWHEHVGELPDGARATLGTWARVYGVVPTERAIAKAAALDSLETSDDVLEVAHGILSGWARRGWCSP